MFSILFFIKLLSEIAVQTVGAISLYQWNYKKNRASCLEDEPKPQVV